MKEIILFGVNCGKCKKTEAIIRKVVTNHSIEARIEKIETVDEMIKYNINYLPSVIIDGVIKFKGIVPTEKEVLKLLL